MKKKKGWNIEYFYAFWLFTEFEIIRPVQNLPMVVHIGSIDESSALRTF